MSSEINAAPLTLFFGDREAEYQPLVGGKCASLGAMTVAGLPVPIGFSVTTAAFDASLGCGGVLDAIGEALAGLDPTDVSQLAIAANACRQAVLRVGLSRVVRDAVSAAYRQLSEQTGVHDTPVAVRSSATAEDQPDASFAGQQDTYLWIRGENDVIDHVVRCWASLYTDRAIAYRHENGYSQVDVAMGVAVQQMVLPKTSGVAFTVDPTTGDRSTIVIDAAFGLGEAVVSGEVTPDNFMIDKVMFEITRRTISTKEVECCLEGDAVVHRPLDAVRASSASLTDDEVKAVARLARQAERHFGRPQDVEWALTLDDAGGPVVHMLQSRPETVWSNKARQVSSGVLSGVEGVVNNLLKPTATSKASPGTGGPT